MQALVFVVLKLTVVLGTGESGISVVSCSSGSY
jgi:hypothetical protein